MTELQLTFLQSFLHDLAVKCKPVATAKATTIWVAILRIDKVPSEDITEEDFLWIKCHSVSLSHLSEMDFIASFTFSRIHPSIYDIVSAS